MRLTKFKRPVGGSARVAAFGYALSLLLILCPAPQARAQGQDGQPPQQEDGPRRRRGGPENSLLSRLNLSPEQMSRLREIRRQSEPEARALGRRLNLARRALDEAIYSDTLNETLVEERAREVADAQSALIRLRSQTELKVRGVLTPEQLQSFRELRQRARARQRMQRRMQRRNPPPEP